jgi:hypothetical protein
VTSADSTDRSCDTAARILLEPIGSDGLRPTAPARVRFNATTQSSNHPRTCRTGVFSVSPPVTPCSLEVTSLDVRIITEFERVGLFRIDVLEQY